MKPATGVFAIIFGALSGIALGILFVYVIDPVSGPPEGITGLKQVIESGFVAVFCAPVGAFGGWKIAQFLSRRAGYSAVIALVLTVIALYALTYLIIHDLQRGPPNHHADEHSEREQPGEETDVRVVGVDIGRTVDPLNRVTDKTDTFAPTDRIFAAVRTKGASPETVVGIRWKNALGEEMNGNNVIIRPSGDTSIVFEFHYPGGHVPGLYSLDIRLNGKVVKVTGFEVK